MSFSSHFEQVSNRRYAFEYRSNLLSHYDFQVDRSMTLLFSVGQELPRKLQTIYGCVDDTVALQRVMVEQQEKYAKYACSVLMKGVLGTENGEISQKESLQRRAVPSGFSNATKCSKETEPMSIN